MKLLLKILAVFVVIILLIIGAGFYSLFYTAVPAKVVLNFLQKSDSNWAFDEISGSLSKGFSIGSLTYKRPEDPTKISEIKNIGFEYEKSSDTITIKEFHIDSAYLYIDPKGSEGSFSYTKTTSNTRDTSRTRYDEHSTETVDNSSDTASDKNNRSTVNKTTEDSFFDKLSAKKWILKSISITDLTIVDPTTNEKTHIKEIQSDGAVFENGQLLFGKLNIESNNLDFTLTPFGDLNDDNMGSIASIKGRAGKELYWKLKKDITFSGFVDLTSFPGQISSLNGLNGAIQIINENKQTQRILFKNFSFNDYIQDESFPPVEKLNLEGVYHLKDGQKVALEINSGNFLLGEALFTIDRAMIDLSDNAMVGQKLAAHASQDGINYTITITSDGSTRFHFKSDPAMEEEEILSKLLKQ